MLNKIMLDKYNALCRNKNNNTQLITKITALEEENSYLKSKLLQTEQTSSEISSTQQNLLELLIDSGVI